MRDINENTKSLLKSQKMIGQNRFNYSLKLEGVEQFSDPNGQENILIRSGAVVGDYVVRKDGKVLFAYGQGNGLYLSVIANEEVMRSNIESVGDGTLLFTFTQPLSSDVQSFSLFKTKSGKIILFLADHGDKTAGLPWTVRMFTSLNGLGTDFTESIIKSTARVGTSNNYMRNGVSKACQADDDSLMFVSPWYWNYGGFYDCTDIAIWKSIDDGVTWINKGRISLGDTSGTYYSPLRNLVAVGDVIFGTMYHYVSWKSKLFYSLNKGETWQGMYNSFDNFPSSHSGQALAQETVDFYLDSDNYVWCAWGTISPYNLTLYKMKVDSSFSIAKIADVNNWTLVGGGDGRYLSRNGLLSISIKGNIHFVCQRQFPTPGLYDLSISRDEYSALIKASSISISKGKGGANTLTLDVDNKGGSLNPNNAGGELYGIIKLNKQIIVKQGYGEELIETFTGLIDDIDFASWPHRMTISCRDNLKKALDQTITEGSAHVVDFDSLPLEDIFTYLCYLAGIETGIVEATGIQITKSFAWQSYADAFQFLADLASFEFGADEYGKVYFRRDFQAANMLVAYSFEEGVDITTMRLKMSDKDLYNKVKVYGKNGDSVIFYEAPFLDAAKYNIMPQKVLKIDATEATTAAELKMIAERAIYLMTSRTSIVSFTAIAVPWLQVGDFIQVFEQSTMSAGIYRISSLNLKMTKKSFLMDITCHYYGDSIVPGELPTDTATQTADPLLNLIPEMTSNTLPSGVARSSSSYTGNYEPWQVFNSHSDDLFWDANVPYGWIEYEFTELTIVDKYKLKARQDTLYNLAMPKAWTFEGFDGAKWIVLDTRLGQTAWGVYEERYFTFPNTIAYSKYRLNVSANNGYKRLQLEQLAMFYGGGS